MFSNERVEFVGTELRRKDLAADPLKQFGKWWQDAKTAGVAVLDGACLATVDADLKPDARMVLVKAFDQDGFKFFTNYESAKATQLGEHPDASLVIFWPELFRQVRLRGSVSKTSRAISQQYFATRPRDAQLGAHASPQSRVVASREELEKGVADAQLRFGNAAIPCPDYWGGFSFEPWYYEFWQGRESRLHDRFSYKKDAATNQWIVARLGP
jgi:pyridoxamine 5'-phosphate oxidase